MTELFFATIVISFATFAFMEAKTEARVANLIERPKIVESDGATWGTGGFDPRGRSAWPKNYPVLP
jgi:hypothetical protein